jgi:hypothetical protein
VRNEGPITRAKAKLIKNKDVVQLALILLKSETENIDSLCNPSDHCAECEREDSYFANRHSLQFQWRQLKFAEQCCKQWQLKLMKTEANKINSAENRCHSTVPECFHKPLMKVAYKLLSRDKATFKELTPSEQQLWNSFKTDQIYQLLTGEPDTARIQFQLVHGHQRRWHSGAHSGSSSTSTGQGYNGCEIQATPNSARTQGGTAKSQHFD